MDKACQFPQVCDGIVQTEDPLAPGTWLPRGERLFDVVGPMGVKGDAFVAMHGSWNRNTRTGYKIVQVDIDKDGKPTGTYTDFVTGFVLNDDDVWGRPVGVAFDKNGNLFFSEDGSGTIWKVSKQ